MPKKKEQIENPFGVIRRAAPRDPSPELASPRPKPGRKTAKGPLKGRDPQKEAGRAKRNARKGAAPKQQRKAAPNKAAGRKRRRKSVNKR